MTELSGVLKLGQARVEELFARAKAERHLGITDPDWGGYTEAVLAGFRLVNNAHLRGAQERLHRLVWGL